MYVIRDFNWRAVYYLAIFDSTLKSSNSCWELRRGEKNKYYLEKTGGAHTIQLFKMNIAANVFYGGFPCFVFCLQA